MSEEKEDVIAEACARFQEKLESCEEDLEFTQIWTDALEELSEIEKAFKVDKEIDKLYGKTILDIGTDGVKPLYIALKYEPIKIIGINDNFYPYTEYIEQKSKLFVKTEIKFYQCNFFNDEKLNEILDSENQKISDFILLSKTLHHLRTGECIVKDREKEHFCQEDENTCINRFDEKKIFKSLLARTRKRLIVYEWFDPGKSDDDKVRGRGGYFTLKEWGRILWHLAKNYKAMLIQPLKCSIEVEEVENVIGKLRQVDTICFYVEKIE